MGIKDLPKGGINFKTTYGAGNFQKKLSGATRYGDLKNLRDNQKTIVKVIGKYQGVIRSRGGLSRLQQLGAWYKMKAMDKTITKEDKREIKEVLKYLGRGNKTDVNKEKLSNIKNRAGTGYLAQRVVDRNRRLNKQLDPNGRVVFGKSDTYKAMSQEDINKQANLNNTRQARRKEDGTRVTRGTSTTQYGGAKVVSSGVLKTDDIGASRLGVDQKAAFASGQTGPATFAANKT